MREYAESDSVEYVQCPGRIFGDEVTAVAMIDRLVRHAEILSLESDSHRSGDKPPPEIA